MTPGTGTCVSSTGAPDAATYDGWFGFDSIPVINKSLPAVQAYFLTAPDSVSRHWLKGGASGWRMDVMGDASFPAGYWETFRGVVKGTEPDALIISETWQKDSTLLRMLRGDRADSSMNYRLRDAVLGLLAPGPFDSKGFADSGRQISAERVRGPPGVRPRRLSRPGLLQPDEPARQPRHRAPALDADPRGRNDRLQRRERGQPGRRQATPAAGLLHPVHPARRADRLLRRRSRPHRRRRPGRPPHLSLGRQGRAPRYRHVRPLPDPGCAARGKPRP